ncbi:hypothetical protein BST26_19070 [Mycolicibacterium insubricum]|uniref:Tape measure protein N-terminal domain-containing protein n=2 Tax=Mycolicibacterium insubricum TaxID=444597 RepID=A0A1X0CYN9_9MYCO|nr:hypothetical protein BST26_19070 [Mycolicibacterium insubricum]
MQRDIRRALNQADGDRAGRRVGQQFSRGVAANTNLTAVERKLAEVGQRGAAVMGKALKAGAVTAAAGITATLGTALTLGLNRLTAIDDARGKLTALGHDAQGTAQIMDSALSSVKGTAYGLGDAATIAASAVAAGVKPGKELTSYLKLTADAAAVAGTSLSDMGLILNQVRTGRTAYTDDLNQLAGRGLPIYQWIANEMNVAPELVKKMAGKAKISSEVFEAAIRNNISGAALNMGKTVRGAFENVKAALSRAGAAAEEPSFKRLPATLTSITTSIDAATPKITELSEAFDEKVFDRWIPGVERAWHALAGNEAVQSNAQEVRALLASLWSTAKELGPPLGQIGTSLAHASASLGVSSWQLFVVALEAAAGALNAVSPLIHGLGDFMSGHQGMVTAAAAAWLGFRTIPAILGQMRAGMTQTGTATTGMFAAWGRGVASIQSGGSRITGLFRGFSDEMRLQQHLAMMSGQSISRTNAAWSTLAARGSGALNSMKSAVGGLVGALGGPLNIALMGATVAIGAVMAKNQQASQSMQAYQDAIKRTREAQTDLNEALMRSRGAFDDTVKGEAVDRIKALGDELQTASERTASWADEYRKAGSTGNWAALRGMITPRFGGKYDSVANEIRDEANASREAKTALDALKMSNQTLADVTYGSQPVFDQLVQKLEGAGDGGQKTAAAMRLARGEFLKQQAVAAGVAPGVYEMATAMRVLADNTATAADKTKALKAAMDAMNPARTAGDAAAAHTRAVDAARSTLQGPVDASRGVGDRLFLANGEIDQQIGNGVDLAGVLKQLADTTADYSQHGRDMTEVLRQNDEQFAALAEAYGTTVPKIKAAYKSLGGSLSDFGGQLGKVAQLLQSGDIPTDHPIKIDTPGGKAVLDLLKAMNAEVKEGNDKQIEVTAPLGDQTLQLLKNLGYEARIVDQKLIMTKVDPDSLSQTQQALAALLKDENKTITVTQVLQNAAGGTQPGAPALAPNGSLPGLGGVAGPRLVGAIVPMADGGFRYIRKPETAGLYSGRGAGTVFAEKQTGGEAYIPLAPGKRKRSAAILSEVARLFGMTVMEDGGITLDSLKQFASQISGGAYVRGGPPALSGTDCSGAQAAIVNYLTGASGRFGTAAEGQALLARGFQMGDPPAGIAAYWVGWRNGGAGGGHTAGTIVDPNGGNVNVEMGGRSGGGAFGGMADGAASFPQRAWIAIAGGEDPSRSGSGGSSAAVRTASARVTSSKAAVTSAQASLDAAEKSVADLKAKGASADKVAIAEKKRDAAAQRLAAAQERQGIAEDKLAAAKEKAANGSDKQLKGSDGGAESFGQSLISGLLQGIGFDGSVISNPFDWPNFKSAMALANWGTGLAKNVLSGGDDTGGSGIGGGALGGIGLPGVADFIKTASQPVTEPIQHGVSGGAPGPDSAPSYVINGNVGMNPTTLTQTFDSKNNQTIRRNLAAVRPG